MKQYCIKLGVAPTRRNLFSKEEAIRFKGLTYKKLAQMGVDFVGIEEEGNEGLLFGEETVARIVSKFQAEKVDALFFPHVNFGTEDLVCKVAAQMKLPVLIWGPRDDAPLADGIRSRDSQCGLFATGKVLRRFRIPFNYLTNCTLEDPAFERGIRNFIAVANVVKELKGLRILQISTRPADFWTTMYNEGELLERFGIQVHPIAMPELTARVKKLQNERPEAVQDAVRYLRENVEICVENEDAVTTVAALKAAMEQLAGGFGCKAIAIQCWNALQGEIGIMPCAANGLLTDIGLPVVCETDIHGAITMIIAQAASMGTTSPFFADWTVRHPDNDNGELLQHCGPYPISLARGEKKLVNPFCFSEYPGAVIFETIPGKLNILRFDGDNGGYKLLAGRARVIDGPYNAGSYCWIEVDNWPKLERKLVEGPYIHHCVGVYADVIPVLYEAARYFDGKLDMDFYDADAEEQALNYLLGL